MAYRRNNANLVYLRDHIVIVVPDRPQINVIRAEEPAGNDLSGRIRFLMAYQHNYNVSTVSLRIADHIVIVVPDRPQINVIRAEEPGDDMSGRINNILNVYVASHGAILTAVFSVQGPIRSEIWVGILILSGVISAAITIVLLRIFLQQFSLMRTERGLRDSIVENSTWVAQRAAFVLMIMGLSICLFFTCSRLLFSRLP